MHVLNQIDYFNWHQMEYFILASDVNNFWSEFVFLLQLSITNPNELLIFNFWSQYNTIFH